MADWGTWWDPSTWSSGGTTVGEGIENLGDWFTGDVLGRDAAEAQADAIGKAAAEDAAYAHPSVSGPLGSQTVTRDPVTGEVMVNTALSAQQQALLDSLYGDLGNGRQSVEDALYNRAASRLDPQWESRESSKQTELYNQGLRPGDAAYDQAMQELDFARTDAYEAARNAAISAGGTEQSRLISALMASANPGLASYYGNNNAVNSAIAQQNILGSTPTGMESLLAIISALGSN